jgi:hypothetical protein
MSGEEHHTFHPPSLSLSLDTDFIAGHNPLEKYLNDPLLSSSQEKVSSNNNNYLFAL